MQGRRLTPIDLQNASNPAIAAAMEKGFLFPQEKNHHILLDAVRGQSFKINDELFSESAEYNALKLKDQKLLDDQEKLQEAFKAFVKRALFANNEEKFTKHYETLVKYWNQSVLGGDFYKALMQSAFVLTKGRPTNCFENSQIKLSWLASVKYDSELDQIYVDTVQKNIRFHYITDNETINLPGTITSRCILTAQGFQHAWVESSTTLLKRLILEKKVELTPELIESAKKEEFKNLQNAILAIKETNAALAEQANKIYLELLQKLDQASVEENITTLYSILSSTVLILSFPSDKKLLNDFSALVSTIAKQADKWPDELVVPLVAMKILIAESQQKEAELSAVPTNIGIDDQRLTPERAELQNADNEIITRLKNPPSNWFLPKTDDSAEEESILFRDATRGESLLIGDEYFTGSSKYTGLGVTGREDKKSVAAALKGFIKSKLFHSLSDEEFENQYKQLYSSYCQPTWTKFHEAITNSTCAPYNEQMLKEKRKLDSATLKETSRVTLKSINGKVYVETTLSDLKIHFTKFDYNTNEQLATPPLLIPGSVTSQFVMTDQGFQLAWVKPSNSVVKDLCLKKHVDLKKLATELENAPKQIEILREECETYKKYLERVILQELEEQDIGLATLVRSDIPVAISGTALTERHIESKSGIDILAEQVEQKIKNHEQITEFSEPCTDALLKYAAVSHLHDTLTQKNKKPQEKLQNPVQIMDEAKKQITPEFKETITKRRDTAGILFLKVIGTIFSFGLAFNKLWSVKGEKVWNKFTTTLSLNGHGKRKEAPAIDEDSEQQPAKKKK